MKDFEQSKYRQFTGKSEAHKAFNSLRGIVDGISLDSVINNKEIRELEIWCENHEYLANRDPFNELITNIQAVISDNIITPEEVADMKWLCDKFAGGFNYYDSSTSDLQRLQGICHGILADGVVKETEVKELQKWLDDNMHLFSYYPYDEICSVLVDVLADGKVDDKEKVLLKRYFNEFVDLNDSELQKQIDAEVQEVKISGICAMTPDITFDGSQFCFTGFSSTGSTKSDIAAILEPLGGKLINNVSKNTNYLIVGDSGNECWAYACYGRKVEKAIALRKQGVPIVIIHENDFWDEIKDHKL